MRNFNVGVGARTTFGVGLEGRTYARLAHITGEVHFLEGMNDLINVARDNFNFSPDYEELQEFFRSKLRKWSDELDRLDETAKFIFATQEESHVKDLSVLDKSNISRKINELEKKGFKISKVKAERGSSTIKIDKGKKEILIPGETQDIDPYKLISINNQTFKLVIDKWDTTETFPACRVLNDKIILNENYPLFKNKKYLDLFVKLNAILLLKVKEGILSTKVYHSILESIELTLSDYKD
jgi:hypothetical protein